MSDQPQVHDLMIVFDAVSGGSEGVGELKTAIQDILNFVALADCFERIGVLAYRNYACTAEKVIEWSGWCYTSCDPSPPSTDDILKFVQDLEMPDDSEDNSYGASSKTALAKACQEMRTNGTIILLYSHAPPLFEHIGGHHYDSEQVSLSFGGYGEAGRIFQNWFNGTNFFSGFGQDPKKAVVLSFGLGSVDNLSDGISEWSPYLWLSNTTGGLLLIWMGADGNIDIPESFRITYALAPTDFFTAEESNLELFCGIDCNNLECVNTLNIPRIGFRVPYGGISNNDEGVSNFTSRALARKYTSRSQHYKNVIAKHIDRIIRTNVSLIAIHPLFGRLFAAVCLDRNGSNGSLLGKTRAQADQIPDAGDKRQTQAWLEESYAFFHEIENLDSDMPTN